MVIYMEKVKQVKLGRTNIVCGELGMGCEGFSKVTEKEARDMIDLALSKGMNFIDLYASNPTVRENIGKAINGRREEIYIQGHLCTIWKARFRGTGCRLHERRRYRHGPPRQR